MSFDYMILTGCRIAIGREVKLHSAHLSHGHGIFKAIFLLVLFAFWLTGSFLSAANASSHSGRPSAIDDIKESTVKIFGRLSTENDMSSSGVIRHNGVLVSPNGYLLTTYDFMRQVRDLSHNNFNTDVVIEAEIPNSTENVRYTAFYVLSSARDDLLLLKLDLGGLRQKYIRVLDRLEHKSVTQSTPIHLHSKHGSYDFDDARITHFDSFRDLGGFNMRGETSPNYSKNAYLFDGSVYWVTNQPIGRNAAGGVAFTPNGYVVGLIKGPLHGATDNAAIALVHDGLSILAPVRLALLEEKLARMESSGTWEVEERPFQKDEKLILAIDHETLVPSLAHPIEVLLNVTGGFTDEPGGYALGNTEKGNRVPSELREPKRTTRFEFTLDEMLKKAKNEYGADLHWIEVKIMVRQDGTLFPADDNAVRITLDD